MPIKYCYRFIVLWLTHYTCISMQLHVLLQLVMYNFLFYVIFVKKYCEFSVTLWVFFSYITMIFLVNFCHNTVYNWHLYHFFLCKKCSAHCHISLLIVVHVFSKSISLEILNLLKLYDLFIVALKNCMLISFAWKPFKVFCISRNKEISRLMMVYFAESV